MAIYKHDNSGELYEIKYIENRGFCITYGIDKRNPYGVTSGGAFNTYEAAEAVLLKSRPRIKRVNIYTAGTFKSSRTSEIPAVYRTESAAVGTVNIYTVCADMNMAKETAEIHNRYITFAEAKEYFRHLFI